jgi:membrane-associated protease RseP (regulator of RpoE activity)
VLVRSVEKGSRGEKAGFHAGDVVIKVNDQPVHDTSDFTHALRSTSGNTAAVTVMRDKREQNLTLTLPDKRDSGSLLEDTLNIPEISAETEQAINRAQEEIARISPAIAEKLAQGAAQCEDAAKRQQEREQRLRERQKRMQEQQQKLRRELSGEWTEI